MTDYKVLQVSELTSHVGRFFWRQKKENWNSCDVIIVETPQISENLPHSSKFASWFLGGLEFPGTVLILAKDNICFLCSGRDARLLLPLSEGVEDAVGFEPVVRAKANEDGITEITEIIKGISKSNEFYRIGYITQEALEGKVLKEWINKEEKAMQFIDITAKIEELYQPVKDK